MRMSLPLRQAFSPGMRRSVKEKKMARETLAITEDFIDQCTEMLQEFGAARYDSFTRFIAFMLEISTDCAEGIAERMEERGDIFTTVYADTTIVKQDKRTLTVYRDLDAFDAYLCIMQKEKEENENNSCYANRAIFPIDFSIYVTNGRLYYVLLYDDHFLQKMSIYERKQMDDAIDPVTLVVFPVGTNLKTARIPAIRGKYRYAVVRKSRGGLTACEATTIRKGESR